MITDPRQVYFSSNIPIDKIIGTFTGTIVSTAGGVPTRTASAITTLIPESTLHQGIYSTDGGTTWRDFGTSQLSGTTLQLEVYAYSESNLLTVIASNFTAATTYTVLYKVALIAKKGQGNITPQPNGANVAFDTRLNYQKILSDTITSLSINNGVNTRTTIAHSLGYIPKVRSFIERSSSFGADLPAGLYEAGFYARYGFSVGTTLGGYDSTSGVLMDTTNVYTELNNQSGRGNFTGTLFTRIYYDA